MYTFERSRLITATRTTVTLNDDKLNMLTSKATVQESLTEEFPASISGRTLSELPSFSHPNDLTIDKVTPSAWRRRTVVSIAREGGIELHRKRAGIPEHERASLKERLHRALQDLVILMEWQTANLVLHAFAQFAWDFVSIPDRVALEAYDMFDFLDLFYGRSGTCPRAKRSAAFRIYRKLPDALHGYASEIMMSRSSVSTDRKRLAHPEISQERLEFFLQSLGSGAQDQDPLDVALFEHLKTTSISKENVERAAQGR